MPPKRRNRKWEEDMKKKRTKTGSRIVKKAKLPIETGKSILEIPKDLLFEILTLAVGDKSQLSVALTCKMFRKLLKKKPIPEMTFDMNIDQVTKDVKRRIHNLGYHSVYRVRFILDPAFEFPLDGGVEMIGNPTELEVELLDRYIGENEKRIFRSSDYVYSFARPTIKRISLKVSNAWDISLPDIIETLEKNPALKILELHTPIECIEESFNDPNSALKSLTSFLRKNYKRYNFIKIILDDDEEAYDLSAVENYFERNAPFMKVERNFISINISFVAKK